MLHGGVIEHLAIVEHVLARPHKTPISVQMASSLSPSTMKSVWLGRLGWLVVVMLGVSRWLVRLRPSLPVG